MINAMPIIFEMLIDSPKKITAETNISTDVIPIVTGFKNDKSYLPKSDA